MTEIVIRPLTRADQTDLSRCDNSFTVEAELCLAAVDGQISYTLREVDPYVKHCGLEALDAQAYALAVEPHRSEGSAQPDRAAWLAYVDGKLAGRMLVHENWNRFAIIRDITVDPTYRRRGVGRRLMEQAIQWARERVLPGVMLETQSINVPACRLYESCGFVLGGFDACLYRGAMPGTREIALFWYLLF